MFIFAAIRFSAIRNRISCRIIVALIVWQACMSHWYQMLYRTQKIHTYKNFTMYKMLNPIVITPLPFSTILKYCSRSNPSIRCANKKQTLKVQFRLFSILFIISNGLDSCVATHGSFEYCKINLRILTASLCSALRNI